MDEHDTHLAERIRSGFERLEVPAWSPERSMARGRRRRRAARAGFVAGLVVLVVSIATPLALLAGLHTRTGEQLSASRTAPPLHCSPPSVLPRLSPRQKNGIGCKAAAAQAWRVAAFVQSAARAEAYEGPTGVAEGYTIPVWIVTFRDARFTPSFDRSGCSTEATWDRYTVVVSTISGRPVRFDRPPPGCRVEKSPPSIAPPYEGQRYVDPAGWSIVVPYGWTTTPVEIARDGFSVRGVEITNPAPGAACSPPLKSPGSPAQSAVCGSSGIGVVIGTDTDSSLSHRPLLTPPLRLDDFGRGSAPGQQPTMDVAWVRTPAGDVGITVKVGVYAIPDDLMLLESMLVTFEPGPSH
jgi:hypothetical protein